MVADCSLLSHEFEKHRGRPCLWNLERFNFLPPDGEVIIHSFPAALCSYISFENTNPPLGLLQLPTCHRSAR